MPGIRTTTAFILLGLLHASSAFANASVDKLTLTPPGGAKVGDKVIVQVDIGNAENAFCGLEINYSDGTLDRIEINTRTKLPVVVEHVFKAPGTFKVRALGHRYRNAMKCEGEISTSYTIAPAAPVVATPTSACPEQWQLKGKIAKNGAFTCIPAKGVKSPVKPEKGLNCPAGTTYFTKAKTLGCEKN